MIFAELLRNTFLGRLHVNLEGLLDLVKTLRFANEVNERL